MDLISLVVAGICVLCCVVALLATLNAYGECQKCADWMEHNNKKARIVALEAEITELHDALESVRESLKKLRSRAGMRELRHRRKNEPEAPTHDLNTQEGRDAERTALEKELASDGRLNPRFAQTGVKT